MKISAMCMLLLFMFMAPACGSKKSECPTIPRYPGAQLRGYEEREDVRRISSYQTTDTAEMVINHYKLQLRNVGWDIVNDTTQEFVALYTSSQEKPPLELEIVFWTTQPNTTEFDVHVTISGPYAGFGSWCSSLKP